MDTPDGKLATEREVLGSIVGKERAAELIGAPAPARVDFVAPAPASGLAPVAIPPPAATPPSGGPSPASAPVAPVASVKPTARCGCFARGRPRSPLPAPHT